MKSRFAKAATALAFLLSTTLPAMAAAGTAAPPVEVTEDALVHWVMDHSPRVAALQTVVEQADADVVKARRLPNPEVGWQGGGTVDGTPTNGDAQYTASIGQPLLLFGQRKARVAAATAGQSAAVAQTAAQRLEVERAARKAFAELQAAQDRVSSWQETVGELERVERIVSGRAAAGKKSQYDVERIRLELASQRRALAEATSKREEAAGKLAALAGEPGWHPRALGQLKPRGTDTDVDRLWERAQKVLPSLQASRLGHEADLAAVESARKEGLPVPELTIGESNTNGPYGVAVTAGVTVPLPVFDRNQGDIARGLATARGSGLALEADLREARAQLETSVAVLRERRDALKAYERDAMDHVPRLREMAEAFYDNGEGNIVDLLDALETIRDARLGRIEILEDLVPAELDVEFAAGLDVKG